MIKICKSYYKKVILGGEYSHFFFSKFIFSFDFIDSYLYKKSPILSNKNLILEILHCTCCLIVNVLDQFQGDPMIKKTPI